MLKRLFPGLFTKPVARGTQLTNPVIKKEEPDWYDPIVRYEQIDLAYERNIQWRKKILELGRATNKDMIPLDEHFVPYGERKKG